MALAGARPERLRETGPVERVADSLRAICASLWAFARVYAETLVAPFASGPGAGVVRAARPGGAVAGGSSFGAAGSRGSGVGGARPAAGPPRDMAALRGASEETSCATCPYSN